MRDDFSPNSEYCALRSEVVSDLSTVTADEWNSLVPGNYPFLRFTFLRALERQHCLGERFGWIPQHVLMRNGAGVLQGAVPLYLKFNSYGEFVFDWSWADAFERAGGRYYPKLVSASPYTPATGPKLLTRVSHHPPAATAPAGIEEQLVQAVLAHAKQLGVSSLHWLFTPQNETAVLQKHGFMRRTGCQFHWENRDYASFDDFLGAFNSAKRKSVRRERRRITEQGIRLRRVNGHDATEAEWATFHRLYESTFDKRGGIPTLSKAFFLELAEHDPESVLLILAYDGAEIVAAAFDLVGVDSLFGRHWGCFADYHSLHFEACYYQGLDYCIEHGLQRFESGAQGEHKISRGFLPTPTWSAHWLDNREFSDAIERFLGAETQHMVDYIDEMGTHSPYRNGDDLLA